MTMKLLRFLMFITLMLAANATTVLAQTRKAASTQTASSVPFAADDYKGYRLTCLRPYVTFVQGKTSLGPKATEMVALIAQYMKSTKNSEILVEGYTASTGNAAQDKKIAKARADAIRNTLINKYGISGNLIVANGVGVASGQMYDVFKSKNVVIFYEIGYKEAEHFNEGLSNLAMDVLKTVFLADVHKVGEKDCPHCNGQGCSYCGNSGTVHDSEQFANAIAGTTQALANKYREYFSSGNLTDEPANGYGKKEYDNGTYVGWFKNGKEHGIGTLTLERTLSIPKNGNPLLHGSFVEGGKVVGEWKAGKLTGRCTVMKGNGDIYTGDINEILAKLTSEAKNAKTGSGTSGNLRVSGSMKAYKGDEDEFLTALIASTKGQNPASNTVRSGKQGTAANNRNSSSVGNAAAAKKSTYASTAYYVTVDGKKIKTKDLDNTIGINALKQGRHTVVYMNGEKYTGTFRNGKKNGKGFVKYPDGTRHASYNGNFKDGDFHGKGTLKESDGTIIEGTFDKGVLAVGTKYKATYKNGFKYEGVLSSEQAEGKITYPDGRIYEGLCKNQQPVKGQGTLLFPDGSVYNGVVNHKGEMVEKGTLQFGNGDFYEGEFLNDNPHGYGKWTFKSGTIYKGQFFDGVFSDNGEMTWTNGAKYKGEFKKGQRTGKGVYHWTNGDEYDGEFLDGKLHGWGAYKEVNGDIYVGEYKEGKKNGWFTHYTKQHTYMEELWENGTFMRYRELNGKTMTGEWAEGELEAKEGRRVFPNGDVYVGSLKYGIPEGHGTYTDVEGNKYEGRFEHGELNDYKGTITYKVSGVRYRGDVKHNKREGSGVMLYPNKKYEKGDWKDDKLVKNTEEGKWKERKGNIEYKTMEEVKANRKSFFKKAAGIAAGVSAGVVVGILDKK